MDEPSKYDGSSSLYYAWLFILSSLCKQFLLTPKTIFIILFQVNANAVSLLSPIAQPAEQVTVNHWVDGSNPSRGATQNKDV